MKTRIVVFLFALLAAACSKRNEKAEIDINIGYEINNMPLVTDTLRYVNEAGNTFLVTEVQWFLSNLELLPFGCGSGVVKGNNRRWKIEKPRTIIC